ncbi:MAG: ArsR/SmtB family transcription factor [Paracoccaceae bacterium]
MAYHDQTLTALFHALSDPTRLAVVETLCDGPHSVGQLAEPYDMALPSFLKHVRVLEDAGLVRSHKKGRVRTVSLVPQRMAQADAWIAARRHMWERRLDSFGDYLDKTSKETDT